jgi:hypothetical protein
MLERQKMIDEIIDRLTWLSLSIDKKSSVNLTDRNIHCENFYEDLLNIIFSWQLINANVETRNNPGFDLIDREKKILVQITSNYKKEKIVDTVQKVDIELYKGFRLIMQLLTGSKEAVHKLIGSSYSKPNHIHFDPSLDIFEYSLIQHLINLDNDLLSKAYEIVKLNIKNLTPEVNPSLLSKLIEMIANEDLLSIEVEVSESLKFKLEEKIEFNRLSSTKGIIEYHAKHTSILDEIYTAQDKSGHNFSVSITSKILRLNAETKKKNKNATSDDIFLLLSKSVMDFVMENHSGLSIYAKEEIECCIDIILVDAFMNCKIFERPL